MIACLCRLGLAYCLERVQPEVAPFAGCMIPAMTKSAKDLVDSAMKLPLAERAAVIEALLDSMDAPDPVFDAKWTAEAESRLAGYESGELEATDADAVLAQLRR